MRRFIVSMLIGPLLAITCPQRATAQADRQGVVIDSIALAAYAHMHAAASRAADYGRPMVVSPVILDVRYVGWPKADTTTPRYRTPDQTTALARGLSGFAARLADIETCVTHPASACPFKPDIAETVVVSEPMVIADTATVFMRIGQLDRLGSPRFFSGAGVNVYISSLTRTGGVWRSRCVEWVSPMELDGRMKTPRPICSRGRY